jgi:hypothetical protein
MPGVARVEVDLADGRVVVEGTAPAKSLADVIEGRGYGARLVSWTVQLKPREMSAVAKVESATAMAH